MTHSCFYAGEYLLKLLPTLHTGAMYANRIRQMVNPLPEKTADPFSGALTAADLTIQAMVEAKILSMGIDVNFFGEEADRSLNGEYLKSIYAPNPSDLSVLLDPIDGTRYFLERTGKWQTIASVVCGGELVAALVVVPNSDPKYLCSFYHATKGGGVGKGIGEDRYGQISFTALTTYEKPRPVVNIASQRLGLLEMELANTCEVINYRRDYPQKDCNPIHLLLGSIDGMIAENAQTIDCGALGFIAAEAGMYASDGSSLVGSSKARLAFPKLASGDMLRIPRLVVARTPELHDELVLALQKADASSS
jgi:myo-inositol-1(or 4)-monophosphatase